MRLTIKIIGVIAMVFALWLGSAAEAVAVGPQAIPAVSDPNSPTAREREVLRSFFRKQLSRARTPEDSVRWLYNIFDVSHRGEQLALTDTIFEVGGRAGNVAAQLDMLRHTANLRRDDSEALDHCLLRAQMLPASDLRRETELFVKMMITLHDLGTLEKRNSPISAHMHELIRKYISNTPKDPYDKFLALYTLCVFMGKVGDEGMMDIYLPKLQEAMAVLPLRTTAIRNAVYNSISMVYTNQGACREAIDSDRRLLAVLDTMERMYAEAGRPYRNYSPSRYNIYRRMLANAAGLREPEIDRIHDEIGKLVASDADVAHTDGKDARARIYYLMAKERYKEAYPLIVERLKDTTRVLPYAEIMYKNLITAAEHTGDSEMLVDTYRLYTDLLLERIRNRKAESFRELAIAYSVDAFRQEKIEAEAKYRQSLSRANRNTTIIWLLIVLTVGVLAFVFWRQRQKARATAKTIEKVNATLQQERDNLEQVRKELTLARDEAKSSDKLKTDFINNMSHEVRTPLNAIAECSQLIIDCVPEDKRRFLDKFGRVIELNVALLLRLVNDVLDIASLEHSRLSVNKTTTPVVDICNFAIANTLDKFSENVMFSFNPSDDVTRTLVSTDKDRVSQVLMNLLDNAAKFTQSGLVTLGVEIDADRRHISFAVTDTGIGIPRGAEALIFERFRKIDQNVQGYGLGLYISRLVAKVLGGELKLDADYRGGARFVFTIPLEE